MKNQDFNQTGTDERWQKLEAALLEKTRNILPDWQVKALITQISVRQQHTILTYTSPVDFTAALSARLDEEDGIIVFGSANFGRNLFRECYVGILQNTDEPAAAVIIHPNNNRRSCTVHIYIPRNLFERSCMDE